MFCPELRLLTYMKQIMKGKKGQTFALILNSFYLLNIKAYIYNNMTFHQNRIYILNLFGFHYQNNT